MNHKSVLVVEDEAGIRELLKFALSREGYRVNVCSSAEEAEKVLEKSIPDLVLLDLMLPGKDGFTFCKELRANAKTAELPVIMVTARSEDADIVAGLEIGADDYISKPFSPRVLSARVKATLRRRAIEPGDGVDVLKCGPFEIDHARHEVKVKGKVVELTLSEFKALDLFCHRPGVVFSRYQIVDAVHGSGYPVTDRSVDVVLVGLRKKLGAQGNLIETVRGVGYRMADSIL